MIHDVERRLADARWTWAHPFRIEARDGVTLFGLVDGPARRRALQAMAASIPRSAGVRDCLLERGRIRA